MSEEGELTGGDRREGKGNKVVHRWTYTKISKSTTMLKTERREGEGGGGRGEKWGRAN